MLARLSRKVVARPWLPLAVLLTTLGIAAVMLPQLHAESGTDVFLERGSPLWRINEQTKQRFTSDELIFVAYRTDDPFAYDRLRQLRQLGQQIERLHARAAATADAFQPVDEVTSLATVDDLHGCELSFQTVPLVPDPVPTDRASLTHIRQRARDNLLISQWLTSSDPQLAALLVRLQPELDDDQDAATVAALRTLLRSQQRRIPQTRYFLGGEPVLNADTARYQTEDLQVFIPVVYMLIALLVFVYVRRLRTLAGVLLAVCIALAGAMSMLVVVGSSLNNCSAMLPPVMMTLTVAILLHFFSEHAKSPPGSTPVAAAQHTLASLLVPTSIAVVTTAVGFASLAVSPVPAVWGFGLAAAGGMGFAFVVGIALFALAARHWAPEQLVAPHSLARSRTYDAWLTALGKFVVGRPVRLLVLFGLLLIAVTLGAGRLHVDMNAIHFFDTQAPVHVATDLIDQKLGGTEMLVVAIDGRKSDQFTQPSELKRLLKLQQFIKGQLDFPHVTSVVDFIKLMHRAFFNDDQRYFRLPDTEQQVAQLMLLAGDPRLDEYVDPSRRYVRLVARTPTLSLRAMTDRIDRLKTYLAQHFSTSDGYAAHVTGETRLAADLTLHLIWSLIYSLTVSVSLIMVIFLLLFRSWRTALVAFVPNVLPIALNLGLMGWMGIDLDAATVMISTVALGIAVDDTVHFLQHYRAQLACGDDPERAVLATMRIKGPAIVWTSVVITLGFSVLLLSNFVPTRDFALLICVAMITALAGDMVLLPALLLSTRTRLGIVQPPGCPKATLHHSDAGFASET